MESFTLALLIAVIICPILLLFLFFFGEWEARKLEKLELSSLDGSTQKDEE